MPKWLKSRFFRKNFQSTGPEWKLILAFEVIIQPLKHTVQITFFSTFSSLCSSIPLIQTWISHNDFIHENSNTFSPYWDFFGTTISPTKKILWFSIRGRMDNFVIWMLLFLHAQKVKSENSRQKSSGNVLLIFLHFLYIPLGQVTYIQNRLMKYYIKSNLLLMNVEA